MDKDELEFEQRLEEQEAKIKATLSNEGESLIETSSENELSLIHI